MTDTPLMTRPWPAIAAHFRDEGSKAFEGIADLCDYISARPIHTGVHGWTSMYRLCVVQMPVYYPHEGPILWIEPASNDSVEFRYEDTHIRTRVWQRTESSERVIERFRKTMIQLNWFTNHAALD